jgi:linoleoyl-CoA desaturase
LTTINHLLVRPPGTADEPPTGAIATTFAAQLKARVDAVMTDELRARCHRRLHFKGAIVVVWYLSSFLAMLAVTAWPAGAAACVSLAVAMVAVGTNIQHDANHNAFFAAKGRRRLTRPNRLAGLSISAIGGDPGRWIYGHVHLHHAAPNVVGTDFDIELGPLARLAPDQRHRPWHRYQHVYLWFVYAFTAFGIFAGDLIGILAETVTGDHRGKRPGSRQVTALLAGKLLFAGAMIGLPALRHGVVATVIGAVGVFALAGLLLGIIFQLAHTVTDTAFRNAHDKAPVRWHEWQVLTAVDFCHGTGVAARVVTWLFGGLNYQTEHHLFPGLPHTAHPHIAATVAATCAEHGIRHQVHPTLRHALRAHYRHVRAMGRPLPPA